VAFASGAVAIFKLDATEGGSLTDYSAYIDSVEPNFDRESFEFKPIGGNPTKYVIGTARITFDVAGAYDPTMGTVFETYMTDASPTTRSFDYEPQGATAGLPKYTGECFVSNFKVTTGSDGIARWSATLLVDGAITITTN
jgi:hypothetical protein